MKLSTTLSNLKIGVKFWYLYRYVIDLWLSMCGIFCVLYKVVGINFTTWKEASIIFLLCVPLYIYNILSMDKLNVWCLCESQLSYLNFWICFKKIGRVFCTLNSSMVDTILLLVSLVGLYVTSNNFFHKIYKCYFSFFQQWVFIIQKTKSLMLKV